MNSNKCKYYLYCGQRMLLYVYLELAPKIYSNNVILLASGSLLKWKRKRNREVLLLSLEH
jgi:hypothetical protein